MWENEGWPYNTAFVPIFKLGLLFFAWLLLLNKCLFFQQYAKPAQPGKNLCCIRKCVLILFCWFFALPNPDFLNRWILICYHYWLLTLFSFSKHMFLPKTLCSLIIYFAISFIQIWKSKRPIIFERLWSFSMQNEGLKRAVAADVQWCWRLAAPTFAASCHLLLSWQTANFFSQKVIKVIIF